MSSAEAELIRLRAERDGLLGANHANYTSKILLSVICTVLVVALMVVAGGAQAALGAADAVVAWLVARWWCWPLVALFWARLALYARDVFWLGRRG